MNASAPASSANLGPGFDSLALALNLRCEVDVEHSSQWEVADDPDGFVRSAAARISADPLRISIRSDVPLGKGLGSSAAVLAALETAVRRLQGAPDDPAAVFDAVTAAEGHPDNAAAAVYGGCVLAGGGRVRHLDLHPALGVVVAVPADPLPTGEARRALPEQVPFGVAARTADRAMRLIEGLRTGSAEVLAEVGRDELHEPYRVALRPEIGRMLDVAAAAGAPFAAVSGAGPSVLVLVTDETRTDVVTALAESVEAVSVLEPGIARDGVT